MGLLDEWISSTVGRDVDESESEDPLASLDELELGPEDESWKFSLVSPRPARLEWDSRLDSWACRVGESRVSRILSISSSKRAVRSSSRTWASRSRSNRRVSSSPGLWSE